MAYDKDHNNNSNEKRANRPYRERKPSWLNKDSGGDSRGEFRGRRSTEQGAYGERSSRGGEGRSYRSDKPRYPSARPFREGGGSDSRERRPRFGDSDNRERRPRFEGSDNRERRPRFEGSDSRERRPRFEGSDSRERRPRFEGSDNRERRPRFEGSDSRERRPRFGDSDNRERRPRFDGSDSRERRPRFEGSDNRERRPRFGDSDNRERRPRFGGTVEREHRPRYGDASYHRNGDSAPVSRQHALRDRDIHRVKDGDGYENSFRKQYEEVELREDRLEGRNPVQEAIKAGRTIDKLWVLRGADGNVEAALMPMVYAVRDAGGVVVEVEKAALDKMSQTHAHQGIIAQTAMHDYFELEDMLELAKSKGEKPFIVVLDEIQDAYNLGSILRIADAAGVHGVVFPKRRAIGLDAVVAKASAGAIEHVKCCRVNNLVQALEKLKQEGLWIVGSSMDGEVYYEGERLNEAIALVIGSEGSGMRAIVEKQCDFKLSIPMLGQINSLNAAVAAGIIIFEAVRQRK